MLRYRRMILPACPGNPDTRFTEAATAGSADRHPETAGIRPAFRGLRYIDGAGRRQPHRRRHQYEHRAGSPFYRCGAMRGSRSGVLADTVLLSPFAPVIPTAMIGVHVAATPLLLGCSPPDPCRSDGSNHRATPQADMPDRRDSSFMPCPHSCFDILLPTRRTRYISSRWRELRASWA